MICYMKLICGKSRVKRIWSRWSTYSKRNVRGKHERSSLFVSCSRRIQQQRKSTFIYHSFNHSLINKNIIGCISIDNTNYGFGNLLIASLENGLLCSDTRTYTGKSDLLKMNVKLLYENGNIVSLNGADFSFLLEIEHE